MARYRRVLYVERRARGSRRAFEFAVRQASSWGATLTLAGARGASVDPLVELTSSMDVPVRRLGTRALVEGAVSEHDVVITVGGRSRTLWSEGDPVVRRLLESSLCPVWVLHPAQGPDLRVVVAAVDRPSSAPDSSRRVLRVAADLAADGGTLRLVHCWCRVGESMLSSRTRGGSTRGARRALAASERVRREELHHLLRAETLASEAGIVLRRESLIPALREVAWRTEADVVVVGGSSSTGFGRRLLGSTAERLVGRVPASVLVVPDPGARRASRTDARRAPGSWARPYPGWSRSGRRAL